ncbi:hypothetical protein [Nocardioides sp.]|uniref:hypothetical protein n=1 Tax=Nocardioides sp. TaxID=35761 RepID=UPI003517BD5B
MTAQPEHQPANRPADLPVALASTLTTPTGLPDPRLLAARLADRWDREADVEDSRGNGFAAVILHAHAQELRAAMAMPLSA